MQSSSDIKIKEKLLNSRRRNLIDVKFSIHKIGYKRWEIISKNIGAEFELWTSLFEYGKRDRGGNYNGMNYNGMNYNGMNHTRDGTHPTEKEMSCGEDAYLGFRQKLIDRKIILDQKLSNEVPTDKVIPIPDQGKPKKSFGKKPKKPVIRKADKIRQENSMKKIREEIDSLLANLKTEPKENILPINRSIALHFKFVETSLIRLMIQCQGLVSAFTESQKIIEKENTKKSPEHHQSKALTRTLPAEVEPSKKCQQAFQFLEKYKNGLIELIIGCNKILKDKKSNPQISVTCLRDLTNWISYTKSLLQFDTREIITKRSDLIFKTIYDGLLHKSVRYDLYSSQKELFEFVTENKSYLALVHTMLGSGKTSMILPMCGWILANRKYGLKTKLIFCCPNEIVLLEVAHMIYGVGVPFAIVIQRIDNSSGQPKLELEYKWSTFVNEKQPFESTVLYLCDIFVAKKLLENRLEAIEQQQLYLRANTQDPQNYPLLEERIPKVPDYILIGDELTKDADSQIGFEVDSGFSVTTEMFVSLMKIAPTKIILMSATLPTIEQLPDLYGAILENNPGMIHRSFSSAETKIGCALFSSVGQLYAPHINSKSREEIINILNVIKSNPFAGRFYTFEVLLQMVNLFTKLNLKTPNIDELFDDPTKANQTYIQKIAHEMLETIITIDDSDKLMEACTLYQSISPIDISTVFTSDISRFHKGCLVFSSDPVSTAIQIYQQNFDKFIGVKDDANDDSNNSARNIFQRVRIDTLLKRYDSELDSHQKSLRRINDKSDLSANKQNQKIYHDMKSDDRSYKKKSRGQPDSSEVFAKMTEDSPKWKFPSELQICSVKHLKMVSLDNSNEGIIMGSDTRLVMPEDLPRDSIVSNEILTLLASGIGIYSLNHYALDEPYLQTVILLAKKGALRIIFSDGSIAYGTNLSVSSIIIFDEPIMNLSGETIESITDKHSMKTIFQMLGRAGRGGNLSSEAKIYTTSKTNNLINKIHLYVRNQLDEGSRDEVKNIRRAMEVIWT